MGDKDSIKCFYHYTSVAGLNGILSTGKIWATDCRFLNDQHELKKAQDFFISNYKDRTKNALSMGIFAHSRDNANCIFSLSKSPRVLSQWRSYGEDGRGFAMGFSDVVFSKILKGHLASCVYENHEDYIKEMVKRHKKTVSQIEEEFVKNPSQQFFENYRHLTPQLNALVDDLVTIKNGAFVEEQEIRFVIHKNRKDTLSRVSNGLLIPYAECEVFSDEDKQKHAESFFLPEIWMGPKCNPRNKDFLHLKGQLMWTIGGLKEYDCGYQ